MRQLRGKTGLLIKLVAIAFSLFQLYTAGFGFLPDMQQREVHVAFGLFLTLALLPALKTSPKAGATVPIRDWVLIVLAVAACANFYFRYDWYWAHYLNTTIQDQVAGVVVVLICLEAGRRTVGSVLTLLVALGIVYVFTGNYLPGVFSHGGYAFQWIVVLLTHTTQGVWGYITEISATLLPPFVIFGSLLTATGGGKTFIDLAILIAGRFRGGPALTAVVGSAMFGTISGSTVANVVSVGQLTIPMMKGLGYRSEFAGAVEAVAGNGGQIMPPVMGVAAFIMAQMLGVSYLTVCIAAIIPAILYFAAVFIYILFEAHRLNLAPVAKEQIPKAREVLTARRLISLFLPIVVLVWFLFLGFGAAFAGFLGCMATIAVYLFNPIPLSLGKAKAKMVGLVNVFAEAATQLINIVSLLVLANLFVGILSITGLGAKLATMIFSIAGASLFFALVFAALVCLLLGCGLPSSAAYVLTASVGVPALIKLGLPPMSIHMFIFYYAVMALITPPVCTAIFVASVIAKAKWLPMSFIAMRLAAVAFVMPFLFIYEPALLMQGSAPNIFIAALHSLVAAAALAMFFTGYCGRRIRLLPRIILLPAAGLLFMPDRTLALIGLAVLAAALILHQFIMTSRAAGPESSPQST